MGENAAWYRDRVDFWQKRLAEAEAGLKLATQNLHGDAVMDDDRAVLSAALLWARNHIEVGVDPALKERIVKRLDEVIDCFNPSGQDVAKFNETFPSQDAPRPKIRVAKNR